MNVITDTNIGLNRVENQDRAQVCSLMDHVALAVLCDGMGGEKAGGEASETAIRIIFERITAGFQKDMNNDEIRDLLLSALITANTVVYNTAKHDYNKNGMGTTCVAALVVENKIHIVNAGDSRAYFITSEYIKQVTTDHTLVRMLVEQGTIEEKEISSHPQRNYITKAVGVAMQLEPDYFEICANTPFSLLLCSDGLSNYCSNDEIFSIFTHMNLKEAAASLIQTALNHGGKDNITIAIVDAR